MRKVYLTEKSPAAFAFAILFSIGITAALFAVLPFSHIVAKPGRTLQLRKASAADLPPPPDNPPPPPPEAEKPPEAPPEAPQLADLPQQVPLSADLDLAVGSGGALAGFGEIHRLTAVVFDQDEAFDVADLEKRPEPVSQVPPSYPSAMRKAKIEGTVTVVFVLNEQGHVEDPRIESSSRPEFEKPALDAIRKWRFRPGAKDGVAVKTYMKLPIRFRIANGG